MKLKVLLATILAALNMSAFAVEGMTEIGGVVTGFLHRDQSPYLVKESIVIPEGKALVIESGVKLNFRQGTGIDVRGGSFAIVGTSSSPVEMDGADNNGAAETWNGISVTGLLPIDIKGVKISNAENGILVESGALELRDASFSNIQNVGLFVRNATANIMWCQFSNSKNVDAIESEKLTNVNIWASKNSTIKVDGSTLQDARKSFVAGSGSQSTLVNTKINKNEVGVLDMGRNVLVQRNCDIQENQTGIVSTDIPSENMISALSKNDNKMNNNVDEVAADLKDEPQNAYAKGIKPNMEIVGEPTDSIWTSRGSIGLTTGYHKVFTHHNTIGENYVSDGDTVKPGERYINYFQIPGFFGMFNANITVEAPDGRKLELITELSSDVWNNISVQRLTANYSDSINRVSVGDINKHAGETYLSGIDLFGISYALNLLKNMSNEPLLELSAFGGEYKAPKFVGDKNYKTYKDYVDEGEVEAQSLVLGGNAKFNLHRRFNGSVGFISREDRIEDPILREGGEISYNTANPIIDSKTFFIDGNWLIFPGDVKMNAQVAVGTADTANAATIRAINQVFAEYGLNSSNFSLLNKLMKNVNEVNSLDRETLESIFGDNAMMTTQEMRQVLRRVLEKASEVTRAEFKEDNSPTHGHFWEYNNWAFAGSFQWSSSRTFVEGFFRYVGSGYYSAGSPDLLQNTRLYGANFRQKIVEAWKLGLGYTLNIENAEDGHSGYNIFGFGEGTKWGLELANSDWLNKHRLDQNRTLYAHDLRLQNDFKISENVDLSLKYGMNYRTRNTSQQLYANYNASTGIYDDPWFQKRSGNAYMKIKEDGRTYEVDSARWAKYYALSDEDYIATEFEERILKHTFGMNFTFKMPFNELKLGGLWVYRTDLSRFNQDDLLDGFDFSNKTYGILGYYFHGGDFFEQSYPLSLSTSYQGCRNVFSFTPRFKMYNRNDSREFEWRASNNLTIPVARDFVELTVNTSVRQIFLNYDIDAEGNYADTEIDFDGSLAIRINHTNSFYSEWTAGSVINFRPDAEADDYKDLYLMLSLNHDF